MDKVLIGSSFSFYLIFPQEVSKYTTISAQLRSNDDADQIIAEFTKASMRVDPTNARKVWCDVDAADSAKAYPTIYECVVRTAEVDARFSSGVAYIPYKFDLAKFETI